MRYVMQEIVVYRRRFVVMMMKMASRRLGAGVFMKDVLLSEDELEAFGA